VVLERLQQSAALSTIPVIVLTARDPESAREKILRAGATAFFQKPADNNELLTAIRSVLSPAWPGTTTMPQARPY
jgi:DNA-binding response OmpR family regulator